MALARRPRSARVGAFVAGLGLGLLLASVLTTFFWWWAIGAALLTATLLAEAMVAAGVRMLGCDPDIPTRPGVSTRGPCRPNVGPLGSCSIPTRSRPGRLHSAVDALSGRGHWRLAPIPEVVTRVASGEDASLPLEQSPTALGAITNSLLLLLLLLLLVLPGFFELLTQLEVLLGEECLAGRLAAQVEHQAVEHSVIDIRGIEGELLVPVGLGVQAVCHALGLGHWLTSSTTLRPQGDAVVRHGGEGCQLPHPKDNARSA